MSGLCWEVETLGELICLAGRKTGRRRHVSEGGKGNDLSPIRGDEAKAEASPGVKSIIDPNKHACVAVLLTWFLKRDLSVTNGQYAGARQGIKDASITCSIRASDPINPVQSSPVL